MKFKSIRIDRLRSVERLDMSDLGNLVLIAGVNGAGKSTVVDAIALWCNLYWRYSSSQAIDFGRFLRRGIPTHAVVSIDVEQYPSDRIWMQKVFGTTQNYYTHLADLEKYTAVVELNDLRGEPSISGSILPHGPHPIAINQHTPRSVPYRDPDIDPEAPIVDFFGAHRHMPTRVYNSFNSSNLTRESDEQRRNLVNSANVQVRSAYLKDYFWSLDQGAWTETKERWDTGESLTQQNRPEPFNAINDSISKVLPHLQLREVKPGIITQFLFSVYGRFDVELDDLSSGEKEVVMFVSEMERTRPRNSIIMVDEAELHINSATEPRLLSYLAELAARSNDQIILTTHSTSMISAARSLGAELWRLDPIGRVDRTNQATRIETDQATIDALRKLAGDLSVITTSDRFVFLEGKEGRDSFDAGIVRALAPVDLSHYTLIGVGGAESTEKVFASTQRVLNHGIPFGLFSAILDRDRRTDAEVSRIERMSPRARIWPYCMIENILLDPIAWANVISELGFHYSEDAVSQAFIDAAKEVANEETALRLDEQISGYVKRQDFKDVDDMSVDSKLERVISRLQKDRAQLGATRAKVDALIIAEIQDGSFRRKMHGKNLVRKAMSLLSINTPHEQFLSLVAHKMFALSRVPSDVTSTIQAAINS